MRRSRRSSSSRSSSRGLGRGINNGSLVALHDGGECVVGISSALIGVASVTVVVIVDGVNRQLRFLN